MELKYSELTNQLGIVINDNTKVVLAKDFPEIKKVEVVLAKELTINDIVIFDYFIDSRHSNSRPTPTNSWQCANALLIVENVRPLFNTVKSWEGVMPILPTQMELHYVINSYGVTSDRLSIDNFKREIRLFNLSVDSFSQERGDVKCDLNMVLLRVL